MSFRILRPLFSLGFSVFLLAGCSKKEPSKTELRISGTIDIDPSVKAKTAPQDTIFLVAKPAPGGPPVAVQKLVGNNYPYAFELTPHSLMTPDSQLDVPLNLTVRVDKDGDASTKQVGDLLGVYEKNPVSLQANNIHITVNEVLK